MSLSRASVSACVIILLLALGVPVASAQSPAATNPLWAVWLAIRSLQQQINNIQLVPGPKGDVGETGPRGPGGVRVVDSIGQDVGAYIHGSQAAALLGETPPLAMHDIGGTLVGLPVSRDGLVQTSGLSFQDYWFLHLTTDCSGDRYIRTPTPALIPTPALVVGTTVIYPTEPIQTLTFYSREEFDAAHQDLRLPGLCRALPGVPGSTERAAVSVTMDASALGFVPPLVLQ